MTSLFYCIEKTLGNHDFFLREMSLKPFIKLNLDWIVGANFPAFPVSFNRNNFTFKPLNIKGLIPMLRVVVYDNGGLHFNAIARFHFLA